MKATAANIAKLQAKWAKEDRQAKMSEQQREAVETASKQRLADSLGRRAVAAQVPSGRVRSERAEEV